VKFERRYYWRGFVREGQETLASLELRWEKLKSVTTDGGKNMCGSKTNLQGNDASWL
jgi:hypothetical protein